MSPSDTFYPKSPKHNRRSPSMKRPGNQRKWAACVSQPGTDKILNTIKWKHNKVNSLSGSESSSLHCSPSSSSFPPAPQWPPHQEVDKWHLSEQNWIVESLTRTTYPSEYESASLGHFVWWGWKGRQEGREKKRNGPGPRRREGDWRSGGRARLKPSFTDAVETKGRRQIEPSQSAGGAQRRAHCRDVKTLNPVPELPVLQRLIKQGNEAL